MYMSLKATIQLCYAAHLVARSSPKSLPLLWRLHTTQHRLPPSLKSMATTLLAFCHEFGVCGIETDVVVAETLYTVAATAGNVIAMSRLTCLKMYGHADGVMMNQIDSQYWKLRCNCHDKHVLNVMNTGLNWLHVASESGLVASQYCLAMCYYLGLGVHEDGDMAAQWCRRAADQGHAASQTVMGNLYIEGTDTITPNPDESMRWYIRAAESRDVSAIYNIGMLFERALVSVDMYGTLATNVVMTSGDRRTGNLIEAMQWYTRAAVMGSTNAMNVLGVMYETGLENVVDRDPVTAVNWYTKAAVMGHVHAQYNLARCLHEGVGVPIRDDSEAVKWFDIASQQGHVGAMVCLAIAYEYGIGVTMNMDTAERLYNDAVSLGSKEARNRVMPLVADRLLKCSKVLFGAKMGPGTEGRVGVWSMPSEIKRMVLAYLDPIHVLTYAQKELIYKYAGSESRSDRESMPVLLMDAASTHARAAVFVVSKMVHELRNKIDEVCTCKTRRCNKIRHVVCALEKLDVYS